jgi:hypothetical protein
MTTEKKLRFRMPMCRYGLTYEQFNPPPSAEVMLAAPAVQKTQVKDKLWENKMNNRAGLLPNSLTIGDGLRH